MQPHDMFRNLSPLDHRYWQANEALFEGLADILSEEASVGQCVRVEATLLIHLIRHLLPESPEREKWIAAARTLPEAVTAAAVYEEEETTRHNIRAIVNVIQRKLPPEVRHLVHLGATSVDILDTASALRYRAAVREVVLPLLAQVQELLIALAEANAERVSIGRTHGQHAVPITMGFAFAEYVSRPRGCIAEIELRSNGLRGKLAGAVGAYNATSVLHPDPEALEREVLADLGSSRGSTLPRSSAPSRSCDSSSSSTPHSAFSPTLLTISATFSAVRSASWRSTLPPARWGVRRCPTSETPGTPSTSRACGKRLRRGA
jgi:adenylosuccinate lyase